MREEINCDFTIRLCVEEDETEHHLRCHKAILACRCSFFAGVLRSGMKEAITGVIRIPGPSQANGLSITALQALLLYFYTGRVDHVQQVSDCLHIMSAAGTHLLISG